MRPVTADHILFDECIPMLRPENLEIKEHEDREDVYGYILLDFLLRDPIKFEHFTIEPSIGVHLTGSYEAFISRVKLPKWVNGWGHNHHLFTTALAAVISFAIGRPVKSPRDEYSFRSSELDENSLLELSIQFPILSSGPGSHDTNLSKSTTLQYKEKIQKLLTLIYSVPYNLYNILMPSIRLIHLSNINKRDDFGLAYYLLVSAIEPLAAKAISRKSVAIKHPKESEWNKVKKSNKDIEELLQLYKQERGKSQYLSIRFVEFIFKYFPPEKWNGLEHPQESYISYIEELTGRKDNWDWILKKKWYEKYPEDFTDEELRNMLKDLYNHRSKFTHEGKNPPHKDPTTQNKFFELQTFIEHTDNSYICKEILLPNYQLVSFIAVNSIINYIEEKIKPA